jgi:phosphoglycerate kinase
MQSVMKFENLGFEVVSDVVTTDKVVFLRADFNVPISGGVISDDSRILASMDTINYLISSGAKVLIGTHLGRPKGRFVEEFSTKIIAEYLARKLRCDVFFVPDCKGEVLENLRFYAEEEECDLNFAKSLSEFANVYVNDAFSCSHRGHASILGVPLYIKPVAGFAFAREVWSIQSVLSGACIGERVAVVGGSKVSTKIDVLKNMVKNVDILVVGGGMANTFLFADGCKIGSSLCEEGLADVVKEVYKNAEENGCRIVVPRSVVVAKEVRHDAEFRVIDVSEIEEDEMILDVAENFVNDLKPLFEKAGSVMWNGPLGVFEVQPFHKGTFAMANLIGDVVKKDKKKIAIAGGGDSVAAINLTKRGGDFSFISNAGGAFLEFIEGKVLPGVEILKRMKTVYHD